MVNPAWPLLGIFGTFLALSITVLVWPGLVHKRRRQSFVVVHASHRGGAGEQLENTLKAFAHADSQGTDLLEMDVHLTACGQVVVSHDRILHRLTGEAADLTLTTYADLPLLLTKLPITFSPGDHVEANAPVWAVVCFPHSNLSVILRQEPFALLEEVLREFSHLAVSIDVKENEPALIEKTVAVVAASGHPAVIWGSFHHAVSQELGRRRPSVLQFFSARECFTLYLLFYTGLLPFWPLRKDFFMFAMPSALLPIARHHAPRGQCLVRVLDFLFMRPLFFRHLRLRGVQSVLWTLNDDHAFNRALSLNVGMMTDYPSRLSAFLTARNVRTGRHSATLLLSEPTGPMPLNLDAIAEAEGTPLITTDDASCVHVLRAHHNE